MVWGPIYLAVFFGLLVSAMLYFVFFWPAREPLDEPEPSETADSNLPAGGKERSAEEE